MDSNAYKDKGNEAFKAKNYPEAIEAFTRAIELDDKNHVLYSNRSAAFASSNDYAKALADAEKCVSLNPNWVKGYIRLGAAFHGLKQYDKALEAYNKGLKIEPDNSSIKEGIESIEKIQSKMNPFAKIFNRDCITKIQTNPKISPYMMQPDFVVILSKIIEDPSNLQLYLKDKRVMHVFMELSGININLPEDEEEEAPKPPTKKETKAPPPVPVGNPEALKLKEEGNELYKQKKFDEALEKYDAAFAIDPQTIFLLNRTAVLFEKNEFEECIKECDKAMEHGKETKADYTTIAKLMTRKAFCLQKLKRYDDAITLYKQALIEHRNPDTLKKLNDCEKEKKRAEEEAYLDPVIAAEKKEEGNMYFKEDNYPKAVECYTESIKRNPKEHTVYSNRAAAYLKLGAYNDALADCDRCITLNPTFVKAYARRGHAYFWRKDFHKALQAYDEGLKIDPQNEECKEGRMRTLMRINEMATSEGDEETAQRAMTDPEIQAIMSDTYMQLVLSEMQKNPARVAEYMKDPTIAAKINKLIAAGIIRIGSHK